MTDSAEKQGGASAAGEGFGVAIDVGTSSIWSRLVDLDGGEVKDTLVIANPQQQFGADISSRLGKAAEEPEVRQAMHLQLIGTLNESIQKLCANAGASAEEISEVVAVGNSAMYVFLLDLDPAPLCGTPHNIRGARDFYGPAASRGVESAPEAKLFIPRPLFGFVGSDALADILLIGMAQSDEHELIVDVGTNCEMALGNRDKILVASSPAGPAYEDAHMSFGLSATEGAIYKATLEGDRFDCTVVGGAEPRGICGSGLIDIIAEMRRHGWVDAGGRLLKEGPVVVADGDEPVTISQHDIRSFQLVKASVHAAISVLQEKLGSRELSRMLITGTFGSYINLDNARLLKMFPDLPNDRIEVLDDAACQGAALMLGEEHRRGLEEVRALSRHVMLPLNKSFQDEFVRLMEI